MNDEINDKSDKIGDVHVVSRDSTSIRSARSKLSFDIDDNENKVKDCVLRLNKSIKEEEGNHAMKPIPTINIEKMLKQENSEDDNESNHSRTSFEVALEERLRELDLISYLSDSSEDIIDTVEERKLTSHNSKSTENLISVFLTADDLKPNTLSNIKELLKHENQHLSLLTAIEQYKYIMLELKVHTDIIWNIFYNISDLIYAQQSLVNYLESLTTEWENKFMDFAEIMDLYTLLHIKCKDYVRNVSIAIKEMKLLFEKNEKFRKAINTVIFDGKEMQLQDLILKPTLWLCNSLEHIKSLVDIADGECDRLKLEECLKNLKSDGCQIKKSKKGIHEVMNLLKSSLFVEQMPNDQRKLRHIFLFSGMVVCAKQKLQTECNFDIKHTDNSQNEKSSPTKLVLELKSIEFEVKWFIPLKNLIFHLSRQVESSDRRKNDIAVLKEKIRNFKMLLISEKKKFNSDAFPFRKMMIKKDLEKISYQILKIQTELLIISPNVALVMSNGPERPHTLLVPSKKDLEVWKCEILKTQREQKHIDCSGISLANVNFHIENIRKDPSVIEVAARPLSNDTGVSGVLVTDIHKIYGLNPEFKYSISIEVDSFKLNELKAKTKSCVVGSSLLWNENFEPESFDIDLDCSQTMSILLYELKNYGESKESLIGYFEFQLSLEMFNDEVIKKTVPMLSNESAKLGIEISFKCKAKKELLKRQPSITKKALFGTSIKGVVAREKSKGLTMVENVPNIMVACFKRVEKDLDEEGIYRISGSQNEIVVLHKRLDKNTANALKNLDEYDLHSITGIIKMYLRELPEPLMMTSNYQPLLSVAQIKDESERFQKYNEIIENLPEPNHSTLIYLLKHFERVCSHSIKNQMIAGNLGLVMGMNLIMPSSESSGQQQFPEINLELEAMRTMQYAQVFTHIMHGVCGGHIPLP